MSQNCTRIRPGLVDLQINGFAGVDFNGEDLTLEAVHRCCAALRKEHVVGFLPTLITNAPQRTLRQLQILTQAAQSQSSEEAKILGFHLEGPFISPLDGARGAHPERFVRAPDLAWVREMQGIAEGRIVLVTLSPHWPESASFIEALVNLGIRVALGHTLASPGEIAEAVRAGASLSTHLGNAIPATLPRHPNPIWSQLAQEDLWCSLIGDGFHLFRDVFQTMRRVKGERMILISDSTQFAGMSPGRYRTLIGDEVELSGDGKLAIASDETLLAGSAMSLYRMLQKLDREGILPLEQAWNHASILPWKYLGFEEPIEMIPVQD